MAIGPNELLRFLETVPHDTAHKAKHGYERLPVIFAATPIRFFGFAERHSECEARAASWGCYANKIERAHIDLTAGGKSRPFFLMHG
jgi:hypothetical protein